MKKLSEIKIIQLTSIANMITRIVMFVSMSVSAGFPIKINTKSRVYSNKCDMGYTHSFKNAKGSRHKSYIKYHFYHSSRLIAKLVNIN